MDSQLQSSESSTNSPTTRNDNMVNRFLITKVYVELFNFVKEKNYKYSPKEAEVLKSLQFKTAVVAPFLGVYSSYLCYRVCRVSLGRRVAIMASAVPGYILVQLMMFATTRDGLIEIINIPDSRLAEATRGIIMANEGPNSDFLRKYHKIPAHMVQQLQTANPGDVLKNHQGSEWGTEQVHHQDPSHASSHAHGSDVVSFDFEDKHDNQSHSPDPNTTQFVDSNDPRLALYTPYSSSSTSSTSSNFAPSPSSSSMLSFLGSQSQSQSQSPSQFDAEQVRKRLMDTRSGSGRDGNDLATSQSSSSSQETVFNEERAFDRVRGRDREDRDRNGNKNVGYGGGYSGLQEHQQQQQQQQQFSVHHGEHRDLVAGHDDHMHHEVRYTQEDDDDFGVDGVLGDEMDIGGDVGHDEGEGKSKADLHDRYSHVVYAADDGGRPAVNRRRRVRAPQEPMRSEPMHSTAQTSQQALAEDDHDQSHLVVGHHHTDQHHGDESATRPAGAGGAGAGAIGAVPRRRRVYAMMDTRQAVGDVADEPSERSW